jgi:serine/threonine-protein kinase
MQVQTLFFTAPQEALAIVHQALDTMPGEERLLALQQRVVEQLKRSNLEGLRSQYLAQAQAAVEAREYDRAIQELETALLDCGESPEVHALLDYARSEKQSEAKKQVADAAIREAQQLIGNGSLEEAITLLQKVSQTNQDAAIEQLLRQTQDRFDEVGRRVEAVLSRIQKLSETDPAQALQLLQSQPQAIQQHPQMRTLRSKVDERSERERVTREAVKRADEQLQKDQLREGLETLESVRQAYGDFPEIATAIGEYKAKRAPLANAALTTAMAQARQAVLAQEAPRALELLRKSSPVLEFGDTALQADWKRLADEVTKAAGAKRGATDALPIVVQGSKVSAKLIVSIAAVVLLAVLGAILALRPKPTVPMSFLQLNASPFAEVISITPQNGSQVTLPAGDHATPMRIEGVPEGVYTVVFQLAGGKSQTVTCTLSEDNHLCMAQAEPLSDADIDAIVAGGKQ